MPPFEIKQIHLPSKILPFDDKGLDTLATARARFRALARFYLKT